MLDDPVPAGGTVLAVVFAIHPWLRVLDRRAPD